jgi:hypothetical protein
MPTRLCLIASAAIVFLFGALHLFHTFRGKGLWPRGPGVQAAMDATPLGLTTGTTVWRAWVGFNASHAFGLMLFALVYGHLALQADTARDSTFLLWVGLAALTLQVVLAWQFWFHIPLIGVSLAWVLFAAGMALR